MDGSVGETCSWPGKAVTGGRSGSGSSWTAAKCHRLLRPIQTRISFLHQLSVQGSAKPGLSEPFYAASGQRDSGKRMIDGLDESKESQPKLKRARVTYSTKRRQPRRTTARSSPTKRSTPPRAKEEYLTRPMTPRSLLIPTPLVRMLREPHVSPCPHHEDSSTLTEDHHSSHEGTTARFARATPSKLPSRLPRPCQGLLQGLDSLFRHVASDRRSTSDKCLLAMCLRQAYKAIERLQAWQDSEDDRLGERSALERPNVSFEVYSHLETLGVVDGVGWKGLGEMVRAHSVGNISHAIEDGRISFSVARAITYLASQWRCFDAAVQILKSLLTHHVARCSPYQSKEATQVLLFVGSFCRRHGRWEELFGALASSLEDGQMPALWLCAKEFEPIWGAFSRALLSYETVLWAQRFSIASLKALVLLSELEASRLPLQDLVDPTKMLVRILSGITAVGFMTGKSGPVIPGRPRLSRHSTIRRRVLCILEGCLAAGPSALDADGQTPSNLLAISACIASGGEQSRLDNLNRSSSAGPGSRVYDSVVSLIAGTARQCSRGSDLPPHQHLEHICDSMPGLRLSGRPIADIKMDVAFLLAQRTCDLRDLSFAESLTNRRQVQGRSVPATSETNFSGWEWDAGISEWVVSTSTPTPVASGPGKTDCRHLSANPSPSPRLSRRTTGMVACWHQASRCVGVGRRLSCTSSGKAACTGRAMRNNKFTSRRPTGTNNKTWKRQAASGTNTSKWVDTRSSDDELL